MNVRRRSSSYAFRIRFTLHPTAHAVAAGSLTSCSLPRTPLTVASAHGTQDVWVGGYAERPADRSNASYTFDGTICDPGCI